MIGILLLGFLIPENYHMPVEGADKESYNTESFWYYPWGKSGTHKGVDVFAKSGTNVYSAANGIVVYKGVLNLGGNVVLVLSPKWRLHYYAHLNTIDTKLFSLVNHKTKIGTVGTSGNAKGKQAHLHYSIVTILPYFWNIDFSPQGWKKIFYINPIPKLNEACK